MAPTTATNTTSPPPPTNSTTPSLDPSAFNITSIYGPIPSHPTPSRQPSIIASSIVAWSISLIFVILRLHTRRRLHILGASDWVIIPSLLCALGVATSAVEQALRGAGRHAWQLDPYSLPALQRAAWYGMLFYGLSLSLTRISILLLYRRIFTYNWAKRAIEVSLGVVIVLGVWFGVSVLTACVPLRAFWRWDLFWVGPGEKMPVCLPYQIWWANAALHLTSDLVIIALPMPILSTLKLPRRTKYALVGVFALGFFVCIISVLRLIALVDITEAKSLDGSYSSADLIYWTAAEINAAIVCACAMTLKPLVQRWFPGWLRGGSGTAGGGRSLNWITPVTGSGGASSTRRGSGRVSLIFTGNRRSGGSWRTSLREGCSWGGVGGRQVRTSIHAGGHRRSVSDVTSGGGGGGGRSHGRRKSGGSGMYHLPCVEEREVRGMGRNHPFYFHGDEILADIKGGDLEGQRSDSVSTVAGAAVVATRDRDVDDGDSLLNGHGGVGRRGDLAAPPRAHVRLSIHVTRSVHVTKTPSSPVPGDDGGEDQDEKGAAAGGLPSSTFGSRMG